MSGMAVITPCFRGDAALFPYLHRSVLENTSEDTIHHVFVPARDMELFLPYESPRCRVWNRWKLLPRYYVQVPRMELHVNAKRPWPPVRGWIMQQAVKIAAATLLDADVMLVVDSDVVFVRPFGPERFLVDRQLMLYRVENGVTAGMERHVIWHQVARDLLGLPKSPPPPLPDYVGPMNVWDPAIVRAMQRRIAETTGRGWLDSFNSRLHVSEFILYGVFVDEVLSASSPKPPTDTTICHNYYERTPMDHDGAVKFAEQLDPGAFAMMISAKSQTPEDVRQTAIQRAAEVVASSG